MLEDTLTELHSKARPPVKDNDSERWPGLGEPHVNNDTPTDMYWKLVTPDGGQTRYTKSDYVAWLFEDVYGQEGSITVLTWDVDEENPTVE